MQPALATRSGDAPHPILRCAEILANMLAAGERPRRETLRELMNAATGRTDADGGWMLRDGYDALELAQALFATAPRSTIDENDPRGTLRHLKDLALSLPTHSHRSEAQVALQAFSTPLPLAWLAGRAARLSAADLVLEPSAGTGLLACWAARAGCRLLLNEIDPGRRGCLATAFPDAALSGHDGELIHDLLDPALRPTAVLMNPPFARGSGRGEDRYAAARHLLASLARLSPGGRLVGIMPESFSQSGSGRALRAKADEQASLRLDVLLAPGLFSKHGTGVAVRFVVYDKVRDGRTPAHAHVDGLEQLIGHVEALPGRATLMLKPVRPAASPPSLFARSSPTMRAPAAPPKTVGSASEPLGYRTLEDPAPVADQVGLYLPYRPSRITISDASPHPTPLVESLAMGSIAAPRPTHVPTLPQGVVARGGLSEAQLETLIYAGSAFERDLPGRFTATQEGCDLDAAEEGGAAYRCGYFLGDGTGAGKGRQVAGIILDQWVRGNGRHIWLSKNETLLEDARRDWTALGGLPLDIQPLSQWKLGAPVGMDRGILFVTYPTLRSGRADATRLRQILDWAPAGFEGVIAFDEAHAMANAAGGEGSRGKVKGSEQGVAGVRLQNLLPRARILYASATGASDVNNLAYAMRLGLWGPETAFADRPSFVAAIRDGGIAAMELVARDLKALGLYTARALSFAGVEYDVLEHQLTREQTEVYDAYADAWAIIHANLATALEATRVVDGATGATLNANAKSAALSRFEGCKQRFFGQLLLSMKLPSLVPSVEADIAAGHSVVVQLVSTAEAMLDRRLSDLTPEEREAIEIDLLRANM